MKSFTLLFGLTSLAAAAPWNLFDKAPTTFRDRKQGVDRYERHRYHGNHGHYDNETVTNVTTLPGHYLAANITDQHFYNGTCTPENISVRKEWRSLTHEEKMAFVNAELCVMSLPGTSGLPGAVSRFDDFQASHQQGTNTSDGDMIHYTVSSITISMRAID